MVVLCLPQQEPIITVSVAEEPNLQGETAGDAQILQQRRGDEFMLLLTLANANPKTFIHTVSIVDVSGRNELI